MKCLRYDQKLLNIQKPRQMWCCIKVKTIDGAQPQDNPGAGVNRL